MLGSVVSMFNFLRNCQLFILIITRQVAEGIFLGIATFSDHLPW